MRPQALNADDYQIEDRPDEGRVVLFKPEDEEPLFKVEMAHLDGLDDDQTRGVFEAMIDALNTGVQIGYNVGINDGVEHAKDMVAGTLGLASARDIQRVEGKLDQLLPQPEPPKEVTPANNPTPVRRRSNRRGKK
ncbi:hypothetical protein [Paracoccus sp. MKU1]|uniref:hypothetical protein n=1 Tax=Paracoccus sp. MKU1 TaxID=1745182 RepID=UPI0007193D3F|nr:hypothetical protein [Paracoccus sp. MKU1]KRW94335.1 hypothetical protein AQY21_20615 [Paracoccus sp. MKU1]